MNNDPTPSRLDELLGADAATLVHAVQQKVRPRLDQHDHSLILFGTGQLGRITLANLQRLGQPPVAFADNNPALSGTEIDGVPVLLPRAALDRFPNSLVVITVYTSGPVHEQLRGLGVEPISFGELAWCYPEVFLPRAGLELPHRIFAEAAQVRAAFDLWADDVSRREYLGQIAWRSTLNPEALPAHSPVEETYFPSDLFDLSAEEAFVDCGAFDGDSIRAFLQRRGEAFRSATGLEPDPITRARFEKWRLSLPSAQAAKIDLLPFAAGQQREILSFDSTGTAASSVGTGKIEVECAPLDEIVADKRPSLIKMDIEGSEPLALQGAARIIRDQPPILAICLYHAQEHLWQIPLLIHSLNPAYRLFLRRYADECWEIVCYAVPVERCKG